MRNHQTTCDFIFCLPELFLAMSLLVLLIVYGAFFLRRCLSMSFSPVDSAWRLTLLIHVIVLYLVVSTPTETYTYANDLFINDVIGYYGKILCLSAITIILTLAQTFFANAKQASFEFFFFVVALSLSICALMSSSDLLSIYLNMEFTSLILYTLASWKRRSGLSAEAGLKYFTLGAVASLFFVFGGFLIYFTYGTTNLLQLNLLTQHNGNSYTPMSLIGLVFIVSSLFFKIGVAPYHMWAADVYGGAPTIVSSIFAVVPKTAFLTVLFKLVFIGFSPLLATSWSNFFWVCGFACLFISCVCSIGEKRLKRLFAFSGIGHVGLMCLCLSIGTLESLYSFIFYLGSYVVLASSFWLFLTFLSISKEERLLTIRDCSALHYTDPTLSFGITCTLLSFAGIPPFMGFFAKLNILQSLVNSNYQIAAITIIVSSLVSAFYYLRIIAAMYFEGPSKDYPHTTITSEGALALVVLSMTNILFFVKLHVFSLWCFELALILCRLFHYLPA